jgi:hypothetical protein
MLFFGGYAKRLIDLRFRGYYVEASNSWLESKMRVTVVNGEVHENGRRVAEILLEMREELAEFVQTRVTMLRTELRVAWDKVKAAIPLAAVAVMFLTTAFLVFTGALVGLIQAAFPHSAYRWFFACLIVGVFWGIVGAVAAYLVLKNFKGRNMIPNRTLEVLKSDKLWFENEVRNRYEFASHRVPGTSSGGAAASDSRDGGGTEGEDL